MSESTPPQLERGLNTLHATSLNVANMLGAGPFITIPLLLGAMHGPQAMVGWVAANGPTGFVKIKQCTGTAERTMPA